jgi:hypothetical protein
MIDCGASATPTSRLLLLYWIAVLIDPYNPNTARSIGMYCGLRIVISATKKPTARTPPASEMTQVVESRLFRQMPLKQAAIRRNWAIAAAS